MSASGQVLLLLHRDGSDRRFWATPGGGVEAGESPRDAARREALEELRISDVELEELWTDQIEFEIAGRRTSQVETFFLVRKYAGMLRLELDDRLRAEGIEDLRWWRRDEMAQPDLPIFPSDLPSRLIATLR